MPQVADDALGDLWVGVGGAFAGGEVGDGEEGVLGFSVSEGVALLAFLRFLADVERARGGVRHAPCVRVVGVLRQPLEGEGLLGGHFGLHGEEGALSDVEGVGGVVRLPAHPEGDLETVVEGFGGGGFRPARKGDDGALKGLLQEDALALDGAVPAEGVEDAVDEVGGEHLASDDMRGNRDHGAAPLS